MTTLPHRRIAQNLRAGKRRDIGYSGLRGNRHGGARCRCADGADQRKDLFLFDQPEGVDHGGFRLVGVVKGDQIEPAAVDAAALVDLLKGRFKAPLHVPAQFLGRAAEGGGLTEENAFVRHPGHTRGDRGGLYGRVVAAGRGRGALGYRPVVGSRGARGRAEQRHGENRAGPPSGPGWEHPLQSGGSVHCVSG